MHCKHQSLAVSVRTSLSLLDSQILSLTASVRTFLSFLGSQNLSLAVRVVELVFRC